MGERIVTPESASMARWWSACRPIRVHYPERTHVESARTSDTCAPRSAAELQSAGAGASPLHDQFIRLRARKGSKIAITATARRLLVVLVALLRTRRLHHQVNAARLALKRKALTAQAMPYEVALERAFEQLTRRAERVRRLSDQARSRSPA